MKKTVSWVLAMFIAIAVQAGKVEVVEGSSKIAGGSNNALSVVVYESDYEKVLKAWKKEMKDTKAKVKKEKGEIFADNAVIKKLGDHPMDIYARTEKIEGGAKLIIGVNLGGAFLNSNEHKDKYDAFAKFVKEFAEKQIKESIKEQVKDAEKELIDREKKQEKLVKQKDDLKGKIDGWKNDIKEAEGKISTNESNQADQKKLIEEQKKAVEAVKAKEGKYL